MILLRNAILKDAEDISKLTAVPGFLNLRGGKEEVEQSLELSLDSFSGDLKSTEDGKYIFVLEDTEKKKILGVSMIASKHGTLESPHFYFQVDAEEKHSQTIKRSFIHKTIELKYETEGPSEIGGLVIDPEHRSSPEKIGKQLSYVRFLYAGMNKEKFQKKIIAELLPPLNKAGKSPLWEAVGRRFTDMDYWEADLLCKQNKEFIFSLFPQEKIYLTFLSREAQKAVGEVGDSTKPAFHMLSKIGFKYFNQVDPFDGGPHVWGEVDSLVPISQLKIASLDFVDDFLTIDRTKKVSGMIASSGQSNEYFFESISINGFINSDNKLLLSKNIEENLLKNLSIKKGDQVFFSPYA